MSLDVALGTHRARTNLASLDDETFWGHLRRDLLPLRPSQYDLTSRCNLTCEGCLFFSGSEYLEHRDADEHAEVDAFFASEAARGIRYGYFGGAEPSLVEWKLAAAARHLPYGVVFTNGTRRLSTEIPYMIHVSVWGRPERAAELRGADTLAKQVRNYRDDPRAVFVFTITAANIYDIAWIAAFCADNDLALTFNHYSPTHRYGAVIAGQEASDEYHRRASSVGDLSLTPAELGRARAIIGELLDSGVGRILYTQEFSDAIHAPAGLYPDRDPGTNTALDCGVLLTRSLRHYNTDLSASAGKCCTPNVSCQSCRLYAQSHATLLARATRKLRRSGDLQALIAHWRLWCALFLNHGALSCWPGPSETSRPRAKTPSLSATC